MIELTRKGGETFKKKKKHPERARERDATNGPPASTYDEEVQISLDLTYSPSISEEYFFSRLIGRAWRTSYGGSETE